MPDNSSNERKEAIAQAWQKSLGHTSEATEPYNPNDAWNKFLKKDPNRRSTIGAWDKLLQNEGTKTSGEDSEPLITNMWRQRREIVGRPEYETQKQDLLTQLQQYPDQYKRALEMIKFAERDLAQYKGNSVFEIMKDQTDQMVVFYLESLKDFI